MLHRTIKDGVDRGWDMHSMNLKLGKDCTCCRQIQLARKERSF